MTKKEDQTEIKEEKKADIGADDSQNEEIKDQVEDSAEDEDKEAETEEPTPETELQEFKAKYLRLYSEFENFRKRTTKEKLDFMKSANEDLILELLPIVDDFERAQKSLKEADDLKALKEGIELIVGKLAKTLEQKGLKPIEAAGQEFDTELHEAITQIPAPSDDMKGKVVDEIEKGYYLGEKVIRYSKVVIGS